MLTQKLIQGQIQTDIVCPDIVGRVTACMTQPDAYVSAGGPARLYLRQGHFCLHPTGLTDAHAMCNADDTPTSYVEL